MFYSVICLSYDLIKNFSFFFPHVIQAKKGILERLAEGPVIGDGGFVFALEKRGYVKAGPWTPEATVENPDAGKELEKYIDYHV